MTSLPAKPKIEIRPALRADLEELLAMVQALAAHHGGEANLTRDLLRRDCLGNDPWTRVLIALCGSVVAGYAALCPLAQLQWGRRGLDLHHLYVKPEFRRGGVATALMRATADTASALHCQYMVVGAEAGNTAAQKTYQRFGFQPVDSGNARFRMELG